MGVVVSLPHFRSRSRPSRSKRETSMKLSLQTQLRPTSDQVTELCEIATGCPHRWPCAVSRRSAKPISATSPGVRISVRWQRSHPGVAVDTLRSHHGAVRHGALPGRAISGCQGAVQPLFRALIWVSRTSPLTAMGSATLARILSPAPPQSAP